MNKYVVLCVRSTLRSFLRLDTLLIMIPWLESQAMKL